MWWVSHNSRLKSVLFTARFNIGTGGAIPTGVGAVSKLGSNEDVANIFTTAISY